MRFRLEEREVGRLIKPKGGGKLIRKPGEAGLHYLNPNYKTRRL